MTRDKSPMTGDVHAAGKGVMHQGGDRDKRVACIKCMTVISRCTS